MKNRKVYAFIILLVLIVNMLPTFADTKELVIEPNLISLRFTNINIFLNDFYITDQGKAVLTSSIDARNADRIKIYVYLQKYQNGQWTNIKSWSTIQSGLFCGIGEVWYVESGFQYRMTSYGYVYKDNVLVESTSYSGKKIIY